MLKIQVMKDIHWSGWGRKRQVSVRRKEKVRFDFPQGPGDAVLKPDVIEQRVPGLRMYYNGINVIRKNEPVIKLPVKEESETVFRMLLCDPFECFKSEPANAFQLVFQ